MILDAHIHLLDKMDGYFGESIRALRNGIIKIGYREMLDEHHPQYVTEEEAEEIDRIAREAVEHFIKTSSYSDVM